MRLKQTTNDTTVTPVYDAETVRRTLARAVEIEAQPEDTALSAAQIEALGEELGISPAAVRQSLGEMVGVQQPIQQSYNARLKQTQQVVKAVSPGLLYGLAMFVLFSIGGAEMRRPGGNSFWSDMAVLFILVLPPALLFVVCWRRRDYRQGALVGLVAGIAIVTGFLMGTAVALTREGGTTAHLWDSFWLCYIGIGVLVGAFSSMGRQAYDALATKSKMRNARSNR